MVRHSFNEIYEPVFTTKARYIDICGGRGRGGSHFGTAYFLFLLITSDYFRGVFMREVFNDIKSSLYQDFKDRVNEIEEKQIPNFSTLFAFNDQSMTIVYKPNGNKIISKGFKKSSGKQSAKLKSLAGCTHILIEECEEVGYNDFTQLDASLRTTKADVQIVRIFNPPHKNHWLVKEYYNLVDSKEQGYYEWYPKNRQDLLSIFSTYHDNRKNINDKTASLFEEYLTNNPEYYHIMIKGLVSEGKKGRIYKNWKSCTDKEFDAIDAQIICGLDFGYGDPTAFVLTKQVGKKLYVKEGFYESELSNEQIAEKILQLNLPKSAVIFCDHEPKSKAFFASKGINIKQAAKGHGSIKAGIKEIKGFEVYLTENSVNLWTENEEYSWALDVQKNPTDTPIDKWNHGMDAIRMAKTSKETQLTQTAQVNIYTSYQSNQGAL